MGCVHAYNGAVHIYPSPFSLAFPIARLLGHHSSRSTLLNKAQRLLKVSSLERRRFIFSRQEFKELTQEINLLLTFDPQHSFPSSLTYITTSGVAHLSEMAAAIHSEA